MHGITALRRNSVVVTSLSCSPTGRQKPAWRVALSTFQQQHHVLLRLMCLRHVMCPSCFPSHRCKTWVRLLNWIQKETKIICPAFGLYSSPAECSTMGHIVLNLTNLAYQPTTKSLEQPGHPKRHVTFAMSERKTAYSAHAPDMHEDEDEDDRPLVRPASRNGPAEKRRDPAAAERGLSRTSTHLGV